jgi:hypothetical protein
MSKYLNADMNLDLSRVPRVLTLPLVVAVSEVDDVSELHLGRKTSDRFAASLAMELKMSGRLSDKFDIFLLEPMGWKGYYFVIKKGEDGSEIVDLDDKGTGRVDRIVWRQVKLDRWIRFPFMSINYAMSILDTDWKNLRGFYDDAQSCRYSVE